MPFGASHRPRGKHQEGFRIKEGRLLQDFVPTSCSRRRPFYYATREAGLDLKAVLSGAGDALTPPESALLSEWPDRLAEHPD